MQLLLLLHCCCCSDYSSAAPELCAATTATDLTAVSRLSATHSNMEFRQYVYFEGRWVFNTGCEQPEDCSRKRMKATFKGIVDKYIAQGYEMINLSVPGKRIYCLQKDGCIPLKVALV